MKLPDEQSGLFNLIFYMVLLVCKIFWLLYFIVDYIIFGKNILNLKYPALIIKCIVPFEHVLFM